MALNDDIKKFAAQIQRKLIELSSERTNMERKAKKGGKKYGENLYKCKKLWSVLTIVFVPTYTILDVDSNEVYNFLAWTETEIRIFMDKVRYLFRLEITPYDPIRGIDYNVIAETETLVTGALPEGGAPTWIIEQDSNGNPIWAEFPTIFEAPTELV